MPLSRRAHYSKIRRRARRAHPPWLLFGVVFGSIGAAAGWGVVSGWSPLGNRASNFLPEFASPLVRDWPEGSQGDSSRDSSVNVVVPEPKVPDSLAAEERLVERSPLVFTDVGEQHWAKPYIDALTARGVLSGLPDGTFVPDRPLSRAELATQIANAFELAPTNSSKAFQDLPTNYWATEPIDQAVKMGFMTGYPGETFRPEAVVSRLQVLVALATGLSLPETTASRQRLQEYRDWEKIPSWARQSVGAVMQAGIITPDTTGDNLLRPQEPATRAEVATLIYASLAYLGQVGVLPEEK